MKTILTVIFGLILSVPSLNKPETIKLTLTELLITERVPVSIVRVHASGRADEAPSANQGWAVGFAIVGAFLGLSSIQSKRKTQKRTYASHVVKPPLNAEFLFYLFMTPQNCDAIVGDLEERYKLIHKKFGRRRANFWYWTQVVVSLGPIVWACGKRVVMKPALGIAAWAVAKGLVNHDSWLAAVVELWRRVRS